jgi:TatD DNase family protein
MLTDSHCHLASHRFIPEEIPELIRKAHEAGINRLITLATCLEDVPANLKIAEEPGIHACIGIHPCDVHNAPDDAPEQLATFAGDPRVAAIGETGLDYFHPAPDGWDEDRYREQQRDFLHRHFQLAAAAKLNIVIHTRDKEGQASLDDALAIYKEYHQQVRAVFHCFISTAANAQRVFDMGGIVSFGGVATFKSAREVRETILSCPAGSFMLETDAPYLAPEPHRGKRNEPAFVLHTAQYIAALRGETLDELAAHSNRTTESFFRLGSNIG